MKRIAVHIAPVLLMCVMILQCGMKTYILACFEWNREYIVATQCENINRPWLRCEGKCFLAKALEKESKQSSSGLSIKETDDLLFTEIPLIALPPVQQEQSCFYGVYRYSLYDALRSRPFQPPDIA